MPILFLKSVLGFFTSSFKSTLTFFAKYPKQAFIILACVLALLGGMKIKHDREEFKAHIAELTTQLNDEKAQNTQLKLDVRAALIVNAENKRVIENLSVAASDSKKEVDELKTKQQVIQTKIVTIREHIAESKPEDDGKVAKVLKDTIEAIQKDREQTK